MCYNAVVHVAEGTELWLTMAGIRFRRNGRLLYNTARVPYSVCQERMKVQVLHLTPIVWEKHEPHKGHYISLCGIPQIKRWSLPWHHRYIPICKKCQGLAKDPIVKN